MSEQLNRTAMSQLQQQLDDFIQHKVPMMSYAGITPITVNETYCVVKIPLCEKTKNHLNSMYFGALAVGADGAGGVLALYHIFVSRKNISLVFKDFSAEFLRRPEADVYFTCRDGSAIAKAIQETLETEERVNIPLTIIATTPTLSGDEPVAKFILTLSLKV